MAILITSPKSLTTTVGAVDTAVGQITEATLSDSVTLQELMVGDSRYPLVVGGGQHDVVLSVTTADVDLYDDYNSGNYYEDVTLVADGYSCGADNSASTITIVLSKAALISKGELGFSADGGSVATYSLEFKLVRACDDVADPTLTITVA